jgi:hypothetical protein
MCCLLSHFFVKNNETESFFCEMGLIYEVSIEVQISVAGL